MKKKLKRFLNNNLEKIGIGLLATTIAALTAGTVIFISVYLTEFLIFALIVGFLWLMGHVIHDAYHFNDRYVNEDDDKDANS